MNGLTDPFMSCDVISSAMSRKTFEEIKSRLKYSKAGDHDANMARSCITKTIPEKHPEVWRMEDCSLHR